MDLHQLWTIVSLPDNVPIVLLLFVVPFYTWYGLKQAFANDRLITQLEADPAMAKTHHRKVQPWKPGWAKEVHVWPFLLRIELLATIIVALFTGAAVLGAAVWLPFTVGSFGAVVATAAIVWAVLYSYPVTAFINARRD